MSGDLRTVTTGGGFVGARHAVPGAAFLRSGHLHDGGHEEMLQLVSRTVTTGQMATYRQASSPGTRLRRVPLRRKAFVEDVIGGEVEIAGA